MSDTHRERLLKFSRGLIPATRSAPKNTWRVNTTNGLPPWRMSDNPDIQPLSDVEIVTAGLRSMKSNNDTIVDIPSVYDYPFLQHLRPSPSNSNFFQHKSVSIPYKGTLEEYLHLIYSVNHDSSPKTSRIHKIDSLQNVVSDSADVLIAKERSTNDTAQQASSVAVAEQQNKSRVQTAYASTTPFNDVWMESWMDRIRSGVLDSPPRTNLYHSLREKEKILDRMLDARHDSSKKISTPPPITRDMETKIGIALEGFPHDVIVDAFNIPLTVEDLETLGPGRWLNDQVINMYAQLIMKRAESVKMFPSVYMFNTFFYSRLKEGGYERVRRWTRKIDIFSYDMLLVPVHLGVHWCLAVIDLREKVLIYFDSLLGKNKACLEMLKEYIACEAKEKGKTIAVSEWNEAIPSNIPTQQNGFDCGVFLCVFAEYASRRHPFEFSQKHMSDFRIRISFELIQSNLLVQK